MEEIASRRQDDDNKKVRGQSSRHKAESWTVSSGDCAKIKLTQSQVAYLYIYIKINFS